MAQDIISRQQPKYGQGSIRGLTNAEKRKLRRQNIKDAGKGGLASVYNAITDLPNRIAKIPVAAVDQIAGTDIQGAMDRVQSAPIQALRDSASNTKAFDKGSEAADALVGIAALLGAGRMGGSNVKTASRPNPNSILDNMVKDAGYKQSAINNTNIPKYVEMTNNPKPSIGGAKKVKTTLGDIAKELGFKDLSQAKASAKQGGFNNVKEMFNEIIESNREAMSEYEATGPKADAVERGLYEYGNAEKARINKEINDKLGRDKYISAEDAEILANDRGMMEDMAKKDGFRDLKQADYLAQNEGYYDYLDMKMNEVNNKPANTSKARAERLKNSNRSRAERTLLKKTEREAQQALDDVHNLSLEKMYNQWKNLNRQ